MNRLVEIALSQYGVTEKTGKLHNPTIVNYFKEIDHKWVTNDETAWCSAFINWVALQANMKEIILQLSGYMNSFDWAYIFTFILISYGLNSEYITNIFYKIFRFKIATRYRVLIIGVLYGTVIYFIRDYTINSIEVLLQSFVFALVFHKLLVQKVIRYFFQIKPPKPTQYEQ